MLYAFLSVIISIVLLVIIEKIGLLDLISQKLGCSGNCLFRIIFLVGFFCIVFNITKALIVPYTEWSNVYLDTKVELSRYEKVEKKPYGKEIGTIPADTVLKVARSRTKGSITWIEAYVIENGKAEKAVVIIPKVVEVNKSTDFYDYHESNTSKTFEDYYQKINEENKNIKQYYAKKFMEKLEKKGIEIKYSDDNILKESIKETHFIFPSSGYFGEYVPTGNGFYYIDKTNKKEFDKLLNSTTEEYDRNKKEYFPDKYL